MLRACVFLLLFIPSLLKAQASSGIKIGGGLYHVSGIQSNYGSGYEAGFFSKAELGRKASLLVELDYSDKKSEIISADKKSILELNFANVRFSGAFDFSEHFFIAAGPSFSYMIHPNQSPQLIPSSYFTHFAVGLDPCIGFETIRFLFLARYDYSLTVLTLESTPEAKGNILKGARMSGVGVLAGVKF